jgi:hypothetical protein
LDQDAEDNRIRNKETTMNRNTMLKGAFVAFCLIGMLVLPAAAAPTGQATTAKLSTVDQGLKDDLWANHQQYRLQGFDTNVQRANSVITILSKYGVDTSTCQATLSTISGKRSALETALTSKDKEGLKTVDADLKTLWQQFRTDMKDAIKAHFGSKAKGMSTAGTAGAGPGTATP